jgi:hypothetical protein
LYLEKPTNFWKESTMFPFLLAVGSVIHAQAYENRLISQLGHDNYRLREKSQAALVKRMHIGLYARLRDTKHPNLETCRRVEKILREYEEKRESVSYPIDLQGYPDYPWIDSIPDESKKVDRQETVSRYLCLADETGATNDGSPHWTNYRRATELWARVRIKECVKKTLREAKTKREFKERMRAVIREIEEDMAVMMEGDDAYCKNHKLQNPLRVKQALH